MSNSFQHISSEFQGINLFYGYSLGSGAYPLYPWRLKTPQIICQSFCVEIQNVRLFLRVLITYSFTFFPLDLSELIHKFIVAPFCCSKKYDFYFTRWASLGLISSILLGLLGPSKVTQTDWLFGLPGTGPDRPDRAPRGGNCQAQDPKDQAERWNCQAQDPKSHSSNQRIITLSSSFVHVVCACVAWERLTALKNFIWLC